MPHRQEGRTMFHRTCKPLILLTALWLVPAVHAATTPTTAEVSLSQAANGGWRSDANKARNVYRHPVETLEFFGIKPDMNVFELSPGGGWYTEILAPYLAPHGHLIEAASPKAEKFNAKLKADPAIY